ncbi:RidA family protein [Bacillus chungangensis]|uniref:2-iminobutanoate/2-iminopropanoate deaminase n=1 Tax=Bacillus chungangensis TaxID=587633 RepID=A0ABT9WY39_9BACI|nr:RidA family protein [Bacillus chungangensis]MDQ0178096.1 2-iminobutanoate/2-iminopropanoate deaminase [Bacillus chungangensis]
MNQKIESQKAPAAIGPYSQAIKAENTIYISGQLPIDATTGEFAGNDIKSQTKQSLENIKAVLAEVEADMSDVVKTTVLMKNIADFGDMNEVYANYFTGTCPARAAYQVAALPKDALVEIEAIAVIK